MKKITKVKTATIMVDGNRFECDTFPLYLNSDAQLPTTTMKDLPVTGSNFKKQLTALGSLIIGGDGTVFKGLRFLVALPDGRSVGVRIKNLGARGLFALATTGMNIPETTFNGKTVKDYRVLYNDPIFLSTLMERLEGVKSLVDEGRITITLSEDISIAKTKWKVPKGQYPAEVFTPKAK